jgi:hypothetical protein
MTRTPHAALALLAISFGLVAVAPAQAASLQQVSNWGASGVPSCIAMFIYVPDKVATKPPILVVSHYCSGDAAGVFSEAKSGGIVAGVASTGWLACPDSHSGNIKTETDGAPGTGSAPSQVEQNPVFPVSPSGAHWELVF